MRRSKHLAAILTCDLTWASKAKYCFHRVGLHHWDCGPRQVQGKTIELKFNDGQSSLLRRGSTDLLVFQEVFLMRPYYRACEALGISPSPGQRFRVLDLGANVGLAAAMFARLFPGADILCVEPDRDNYCLLERNLGRLGAGRAKAVRGFVGGAPGVGYLKDPGIGAWGLQLSHEYSPGSDPIAVQDVPALLDMAGWSEVDLLKCDIENAEEEVFDAGCGWMRQIRAIILESALPLWVEQFLGRCSREGWTITLHERDGAHALCALRSSRA